MVSDNAGPASISRSNHGPKPASGGESRQLLDIGRQLEAWRAAVDFARTLVGADRVIVWGTSFGGGHALVTAARDHRIAAAISQSPFTSGLASSLAIPLITSAKITALALRDAIGARLGHEPATLPSYGARREMCYRTTLPASPE